MAQWKDTEWQELNPNDCIALAVESQTMDGVTYTSARISHPDLKCPLWFSSSKVGNLWQRKLNKPYEKAIAYIIRDGVRLLPYMQHNEALGQEAE